MPGTFFQIYIQIIFAVKGRDKLIADNWKFDLHKYIAGIIKGKDQKPIIVNGLFFFLSPLAGFYLLSLILSIIISPFQGFIKFS